MSSLPPQVAQSAATEAVPIDVPVCYCAVCQQARPGRPTAVMDGKATAWDPPERWMHGRLDDEREIYFCATCAEKIPRPNLFGPR